MHRERSYVYVYLTVFVAGGFAYGLIEIMARGFTHISMGVLGGTAMCLIHRMNGGIRTLPRIAGRALLSAAFITMMEFITGEILNIRMGMNIWDYSEIPYNLDGQICLFFSMLWIVLSLVAMLFDDFVICRILRQQRKKLSPIFGTIKAERTAA